MVTGRQRFAAKRLIRKMGIAGRVAALYIYAGYNVSFNIKAGETLFDVVAKGRGGLFAVKIVRTGVVEPGFVENVKQAADKLGGRAVIVLYGAAPSVSGEAVKKARELGVVLKRVR